MTIAIERAARLIGDATSGLDITPHRLPLLVAQV
jgi:hypothetical protein